VQGAHGELRLGDRARSCRRPSLDGDEMNFYDRDLREDGVAVRTGARSEASMRIMFREALLEPLFPLRRDLLEENDVGVDVGDHLQRLARLSSAAENVVRENLDRLCVRNEEKQREHVEGNMRSLGSVPE
jgi:hypothetical protein